jgi:flagellar hook-associated protein 1 FlgK
MSVPNIGLNGGLWMGAQSLTTQQLAIQTIGNNISNINPPGYARQRANIVTDSTTGIGGEFDMGSQVTNIESLRSNMLDSLVQQSLGQQGYADNQSSLTSTVQDALGEQFSGSASTNSSSTVQSGSGPIQNALANFSTALQNLANSPTDASARQVVVQDAQTLASAIGGAYQRLQSTQSQVASDASTVTGQINKLSSQIANLNKQITQVEAASGATANDLRDTREADIESLSSLVNINATTQTDGTVSVTLADAPSVVLVSGQDSNGAGTTQSLSATYNAAAATPLTISGSTTGALGAGVPSSGSLGSDLDVANNVIGSPGASGNTGLLGDLDTFTASLISSVNTQNGAGYDLNGNPGGAIFTGTGAGSIGVSAAIVSNPSLIAAGNGSGTLDGSNALAMSQLQNQPTILPAFQTMVSNLGETVATASNTQTVQDQVTQQVKTQRDSVSGVSIDEEMTNLINFQQAYAASARFINTISSLYSTLINTGTGN